MKISFYIRSDKLKNILPLPLSSKPKNSFKCQSYNQVQDTVIIRVILPRQTFFNNLDYCYTGPVDKDVLQRLKS